MKLQLLSVCVVLVAMFEFIAAAPTVNNDELQAKVDALQEQMNVLQQTLDLRFAPQSNNQVEIDPSALLQRSARHMSFQPMKKRLVSWQPMKKSVEYPREQVLRAIEEQLTEVLRAGETLGISTEEILGHLRQQNAGLI
ncbi:hypothetical protein M3Y98_00637000 [Aphelenchoides besseyi]|nr:hypothetical protein M3Y98_00637000 [Aphelenchoides besseyi]KAI6208531.1 hypothetical protein M3Y96_00125100 [Aphelenchoides besseyi]